MEETLCPICNGKMTSRANRSTGQRFWGCNQYPKCKGTRDTDGNIRTNQSVQNFEDEGLPSERRRSNDRGRWRNQ